MGGGEDLGMVVGVTWVLITLREEEREIERERERESLSVYVSACVFV